MDLPSIALILRIWVKGSKERDMPVDMTQREINREARFPLLSYLLLNVGKMCKHRDLGLAIRWKSDN